MKRRLSLLTGVMLGALVPTVGCNGTSPGGDGGDSGPGPDVVMNTDPGPGPDVAHADTNSDGAATALFAHCATTADCGTALGAGLSCDTGFLGGLCTKDARQPAPAKPRVDLPQYAAASTHSRRAPCTVTLRATPATVAACSSAHSAIRST